MRAHLVPVLLGLLLSGLTVSSISLRVSPNRQQFFTGESVHLSCEEEEDVEGEEEGMDLPGWKLKRISLIETETCGATGNFRRLNASSCVVSNLSPVYDRGVYWCERRNGKKSIQVTITVSARPFILEVPALPVTAGSNVTLRCRNRQGSTVPVNFFKFGRHNAPIQAAPSGEFTIRGVKLSDEGFYWCSTEQNVSPSSRLNVKAASSHPRNNSNPIFFSPLVRVFCHLLVIGVYCITTGLLVSIHCCRMDGKAAGITTGTVQRAEGEQVLDNKSLNAADDVTTEHDF
ncbi:uncharacterized protein LOC125016051 isoform X2 [Mugil cephalus]|uniref:uncharacterized protein LOC125016051 isoform X2 n=1 Tax=Mugil cephalus TaxID=48193 RepID=UPI001FB64FCF|nr:uncharacterized protein LOC125016051 isoform X2 [Mugil cephalus]